MFIRSFLVIILFLVSNQLLALSFDYKERDKQAHMLATATISSITYLGFRQKKTSRLTAAVSAMMITMGFSFLKERYVDKEYSVDDMQANLVGSSVGVVIPLVFTF